MHERIIGLYEENAAAWAAQRGTDLIEGAWLDKLTAGLPSNAAILDIGCGSGQPVAAELVRRGYGVTGIDSSPSLIGIARTAIPEAEFLVADMRDLALGRRFDAVLAWHSFFHLAPDDQRAMFALFAAHAAPRARLMFTSGPEAGVSVGEWRGEPLYHSSLAPEEYRSLLRGSGFQVESFTIDPDATVWTAIYMSPASGLDGSA